MQVQVWLPVHLSLNSPKYFAIFYYKEKKVALASMITFAVAGSLLLGEMAQIYC